MERQVLRGFLANVEVLPPLIVTFQFNPHSISDNKAVRYTDRDAELCGNAPGKVYTGGGDRTISFDLQLHGLEKGTNALNPTPLDNGSPPSWRSCARSSTRRPTRGLSRLALRRLRGAPRAGAADLSLQVRHPILECVVTDMSVRETQFNSLLAPVGPTSPSRSWSSRTTTTRCSSSTSSTRNVLATLGLQNIRVTGPDWPRAERGSEMTVSHARRATTGLETLEVDGKLTLSQRLTGAPPEFPDSLDHTVVGGETLDGLAKLYYGREDLWWWTVDVNPRWFPLDLSPGDVLVIPPIRVATRTPRN